MINQANVIEQKQVEKYVLTAHKRDNLGRYPNHPYAVLYERLTPKANYSTSKQIWHYVYKTEEEALNVLNKTYSSIVSNVEKKNQQKEERRKANASIKASDFYKVGDIVCNSWGYEQTNVDFYQVVEVKNKTIVVKEIAQRMVEGSESFMSCNVMPEIGEFIDDGDNYALRVYAEGRLSSVKSYYYMSKWDGRAMYRSWYA